MKEAFRRFAKAAADAVGSPSAFLLGVLFVLVWASSGPYFHYSDTWQLIVNSVTSVGAFLVVFLIQNTQSRETKVMQLKLDELIRAQKHARTELVQMESLTDDELEELQREFLKHRDEAITSLERIEQSRRRRVDQATIITPDQMPRL
jgi:low affinity Fe/Cu permease